MTLQRSLPTRTANTPYADGSDSVLFASSNGAVRVSKSSNKMTIKYDKAFDGSVRITVTRNGVLIVSSSTKLIAYGDPNLQDLITGVENIADVMAYIIVETHIGMIVLKKTSEDGVVAGIQYTIKGEGVSKTMTTNKKRACRTGT